MVEVFDSLNYVKEIINNSKKIPMSEMIIINKYELLDALEMINKSLPIELQEAQNMVESKDSFMLQARREAEAMIKEAEDYASHLINSHEITKKAEDAAEELMNRARTNARELRSGARDYSGNLLLELEEQLEISQEKLIQALEVSYNSFLSSIENEFKNKIQSINSNITELQKIK